MPKDKIIQIQSFIGGIANSKYGDFEANTYQTAEDLDVFTYRDILRPNIKIANDIPVNVTMSTNRLEAAYLASNGTYYFLGNSGTSNQLRVYKASSLSATTTLSTVGTSAGSNTAPDQTEKRWIQEYKGAIYFLANNLARVVLSGETFSENLNSANGPILAHEGTGLLYIAYNNTIYSYDNSTYTLKLTLDNKYTVKSMAPFGAFTLIGVADAKEATTSKVFIWDGSATTVEEVIDVGDTGLNFVKNVNGTMVIGTQKRTSIGPNVFRIYLWDGGQVRLAREIDLKNTQTTGAPNSPIVDDTAAVVFRGKLYFAFKSYSLNNSGTVGIKNLVYAFDPITNMLTQDRIATAGTAEFDFTNIKFFNGGLYVMYHNPEATWYIDHEEANATKGTLSSAGVYQSNVFPLGDQGRIKKIKIDHDSLPANCGFTVSIKHYGHYPRGTTVQSADTFTALTTPEGSGGSTGKTQSTSNTTYTIIEDPNKFKQADYAQLQIAFDETSGVNAAAIKRPIIVELI